MALCGTCKSVFANSERLGEVLETASSFTGEHHPNVTAVRAAADDGCGVCTIIGYWLRDDHMDEQQLSFTVGISPDGSWRFRLDYAYFDGIVDLNFRLYPLDEGT